MNKTESDFVIEGKIIVAETHNYFLTKYENI
jgi:hypothetical protein